MFSKIKYKSLNTENKEHKKLHLFYCKKHFILKNYHLIINNFVGHKVDTCDVIIQLYKFYFAIYCSRIYLVCMCTVQLALAWIKVGPVLEMNRSVQRLKSY